LASVVWLELLAFMNDSQSYITGKMATGDVNTLICKEGGRTNQPEALKRPV